jgi:hypothetical protein
MTKPLNEFGGWLYFIYITLWIKLIFIVGVSLLSLFRLIVPAASIPFALNWLSLITGFIYSVVIINMLKIFKKADATVPNQMGCLLVLYLCNVLIMLGGGILVSHLIHQHVGFLSPNGDYIWYCSLLLYFLHSKRVKVYYGANIAGKQYKLLGSVLVNLLPNCWRSWSDDGS